MPLDVGDPTSAGEVCHQSAVLVENSPEGPIGRQFVIRNTVVPSPSD